MKTTTVSYNAQKGNTRLTDFAEHKKGDGAHYDIKQPGPLHLAILDCLYEAKALSEDTAVPSFYIQELLYNKGIIITTSSYSGRLSECTGMGWIKQSTQKIICYEDNGTIQFRHDKNQGLKKPCHHITEEGIKTIGR